VTIWPVGFGEAEHVMIVGLEGVRRMSSLVTYNDGEPFPV
jgi:hypothetical protein